MSLLVHAGQLAATLVVDYFDKEVLMKFGWD
jgi:hypothetical protein